MGKTFNYAKAVTDLGERWQDSGNGAIKVRTHAGLEVTLTIREKHPSEPAQRLLIDAVNARRSGRGVLPAHKSSLLYKPQCELVRRKLVEIPTGGVFNLLRPTKAGRIAAKRFRAMLPNEKRRALRAKREKEGE